MDFDSELFGVTSLGQNRGTQSPVETARQWSHESEKNAYKMGIFLLLAVILRAA